MNGVVRGVVLAVALAAVAQGCRRDEAPAPAAWAWHGGGLVQAMAEARVESRLLLVEIGAAWCPSCHQLERDVFARNAAKLPRNLIGLHVDFDTPDGRTFAGRYHVTGLPTTLVLDPDGTERGRIEGFDGVDDYLGALARAVEGKTASAADLKARADASPDDAKVAADVGAALLARGLEREGLQLLARARELDPDDRAGAWREATRVLGRYHLRVLADPTAALPYFLDGADRAGDPDAAWGFRYWVAMTLRSAGRRDESWVYLDGLARAQPEAAEPLAIKAEYMYMNAEDGPSTLATALEAANRKPADDWNHYLVAVVAERLGDRPMAAKEARKALELKPGEAIYEDLVARVADAAAPAPRP